MATRPRRLEAPREGVPTFEEALEALFSDQPGLAVARFAARTLAAPSDWPSSANYALALLDAGRLAEAAPLIETHIQEVGPHSIDAVALHFVLG